MRRALLLVVLLAGCPGPEVVPVDTGVPSLDGGGHDAPPARDVGAMDTLPAPDAGACAEPDGDGDGEPSVACGGLDCDDTDPNRAPSRTETCDPADRDEDCSPETFGFRDLDSDGFPDAECCNGAVCGNDCNDAAPNVHPTEAEVCNGLDDDCDTRLDEGLRQTFYLDEDGDLHGLLGDAGMELCGSMGDYTATVADDCNDGDSMVYGGAPETCDARDNDCDPNVDEGAVAQPWYQDADMDGYGTALVASISSCAPVTGRVLNDDDCDDTRASSSPVGTEACNGRDDDCNGTMDDGVAPMSCALPFVAAHACVAGSCVVATCAPGRGNCDGMSVTGCEADTSSSVATCGSCTTTCTEPHGTPSCIGGTCDVTSCASGYHECSNACVADDAVATCGTRCSPCPAPLSDGAAACVANVCRFTCTSADFVPVMEGATGGDCVWNNARLTSLVLTSGMLSPAFAGATTAYTATVNVPSVAFIPTAPAGAAVTIRVDGVVVPSGSPSAPIALVLGVNRVIDVVVLAESGAMQTYSITITRQPGFGGYVKASNTGASDDFGRSVAIDGDTLVIGAPAEDSASTGVGSTPNDAGIDVGAAYVYVRSGGVWTFQAYLKPPVATNLLAFGRAVAVDTNTIVIGSGNGTEVFVFTRTGTTWTQQAVLAVTDDPFVTASAGFGEAVAIDGDTIIVGAPDYTVSAGMMSVGRAYAFERAGTVWTTATNVGTAPSTAFARFGASVSVSGNTAAIGVPGYDPGTGASGAVDLYRRPAAAWTLETRLMVASRDPGDLFGAAVALDGSRLVVGAPGEDGAGRGANPPVDNLANDAGAAYVFERMAGWSVTHYLKASNGGADDRFGSSVALAGAYVVVGAPREDGAAFGIGGNEASEGAGDAGAAYLFFASMGTATVFGYVKATNTGAADAFGTSVAMSGATVLIGATGEDSSAVLVGGDQTNNGAAAAGAAYVYGP